MNKRPRLDEIPMWKVGGSFATAAVVSWLFGIFLLAFVFALIGGALLVTAFLARQRTR